MIKMKIYRNRKKNRRKKMASTQEYVAYVMEQLAPLGQVANRKMMGEYVLYYQGKVFGGIYDNCVLIKINRVSEKLLPNGTRQIPYPGAKPMFLMEELEDTEFLKKLIPQMCEEIELPKRRKA